MRFHLQCWALICATILPMALPAQTKPPLEMKTTVLAPGLAMLSYGDQGNVGVSFGHDGPVLVDCMYAAESLKIIAAVYALDPKPVRIVIDTHWHHDHAEGNENFARIGAVVMAQENVRKRMSTQQFMTGLNRTVAGSPPEGLPTVTFKDGISVRINGETLRVVHIPSAHTDGDVIVYYEKANVVQMGDLYNRVTLPFIGLNEGGSIDGIIAAAEAGLALSNDQTKVIPGHGPAGTRADLLAYRDMLVDIRGQVAAGIKKARSLDQIVAAKPAARYGMLDAFIKPDLFVELVYYSLKKLPMPRPASQP